MHISKKEYDALVAKGLLPAGQDRPQKPPDGFKSKLERQMAWLLEDLRKLDLIAWWAYEPMSLVIADAGGKRARYTPDFMVALRPDLWWEYHFIETKGFTREAARVRFIAAQERYPFWDFHMVKKISGDWRLVLGTPWKLLGLSE